MPEGEDLEAGVDDFKKAARINFREYPSTALVVVGALTSGLAWMLYRWLGNKSEAKSNASDDNGTAASPRISSGQPRE